MQNHICEMTEDPYDMPLSAVVSFFGPRTGTNAGGVEDIGGSSIQKIFPVDTTKHVRFNAVGTRLPSSENSGSRRFTSLSCLLLISLMFMVLYLTWISLLPPCPWFARMRQKASDFPFVRISTSYVSKKRSINDLCTDRYSALLQKRSKAVVLRLPHCIMLALARTPA